ncbi:lysis system i-spanin subunit Rz [Xenorhabdus bovienii]|uniref:lysis system i-spanin subunit Rz n=1 Tax=Xenorhabdus bovienii TaxID=40576 RepID=UPI00237C5E0B|nr:lysis system i-spanin subunit Rz [Xenorhabdus bovienii]MDE1474144.1 lysis protein [Xenorhabdus bovienii]MDE9429234.1 lysis protein [Xenorhabdus bovienii]MDE9466964.1 lysis protein [Xenorhabdus bovienii]
MKKVPLIVSLAIGGCFGWWGHRSLFLSEVAGLKQQHAAQIVAINQKARSEALVTIQQMKDAQSRVAQLDEYYSGKLTYVTEENAALRADIAAGHRRVQIAAANLATCQLTQNRDTGSRSVGDGTQVELTAKAGRAIYDIRAGIISDQTKLDYLQQYVRDVVRKCKP